MAGQLCVCVNISNINLNHKHQPHTHHTHTHLLFTDIITGNRTFRKNYSGCRETRRSRLLQKHFTFFNRRFDTRGPQPTSRPTQLSRTGTTHHPPPSHNAGNLSTSHPLQAQEDHPTEELEVNEIIAGVKCADYKSRDRSFDDCQVIIKIYYCGKLICQQHSLVWDDLPMINVCRSHKRKT